MKMPDFGRMSRAEFANWVLEHREFVQVMEIASAYDFSEKSFDEVLPQMYLIIGETQEEREQKAAAKAHKFIAESSKHVIGIRWKWHKGSIVHIVPKKLTEQ